MSIEPSTPEIIAATQPTKQVARVFCLENAQNKNIASAYEYGPLVYLFISTNNGNKFNKNKHRIDCPSMWETKKFQDEILKKLQENKFNPEIDYILIAGHVVPLIILAVTMVTAFDCESINFLFWNSPMKKYIVRKL